MRNVLLLIVSLVSLGLSAQANSEREMIKDYMEHPYQGKMIRPVELKGFYLGRCYDSSSSKSEALYVNTFVNVQGVSADLAISTLQVYDGPKAPSHLSYLFSESPRSWQDITQLVAKGLAGTDNNLGKVTTGPGFFYVYSSSLRDNTFTVSVSHERNCAPGTVCDPVQAPMCANGWDKNGISYYFDCVRSQDKTVFKQVNDKVLYSHRTAAGWGKKGPNNLSFHLEPISTYCKWEKQ